MQIKKIKAVGAIVSMSTAQLMVNPVSVLAQEGINCTGTECIGAGSERVSDDDGPGLFEEGGVFRQVTNILLFLVGVISVIMLIIGGIRYVVSGGDQNAVQSAKNTILYAIIGIVVAFLAFAAVRFVTTSLQP